MGNAVTITGLKEMQAKLLALPAELASSIALGALRAGAELVAEEVRRTAPVARPSVKNRKKYGLYAGALRDSVRVTRGVLTDGVARVSILVGGGRGKSAAAAVFYAHMVEFGTAPHWISVRKDARPTRNTRRGVRTLSIRSLNRMAQRGSLKIGQNFVGQSVSHPGARPRPFLRPSMDARQQDAIAAIKAYVEKRLQRLGRAANAPQFSEAA